MSSVTLTTTIKVKCSKGATLPFPIPVDLDAASFTPGQLVSLQVYGRLFTGLVTAFGSAAVLTWPAGAPYDLPPGEYHVQFDLVGGDPLPSDVSQVAKQDPAAAADVAALKAQFDTLLANMKAAKIMAS